MFLKKKRSKEKAVVIHPATPDLAQLFAPDRIVEYEDHLRIDDQFVRVMVVETLPEFICFGWFNTLVSLGGVTVSVCLYPYTKKEAEKRVGTWQTILGADLRIARKNDDMTKIGPLETKYTFYFNLLTEISLVRANLVAATVTILVSAYSYNDLLYKCSKIKEEVGATRIITMYDRQIYGLLHTLPILHHIDEYHDVTSANAACISPLLSNDFTHPSGIFFGENDKTRSPAFLDLFIGGSRGVNGPHMFITGMTRSGKSFTVKGIIMRLLYDGVRVVVIDHEGEYRKMAEAIGTIIKFKPYMETMFNIFEIEPETDDDTGQRYVDLAAKSEDICQLISTILEAQSGERISAEERALVGKAVIAEYRSLGISEDPESIYKSGGYISEDGAINVGKTYKEMPTITTFVDRLRTMPGAERICNIMEPLKKGGGMGFFDGQGRRDFYDSPLIVFDVKDLKTEFQRMYAMYVMSMWVWEKFIKKDKTRKVLVEDEAWLMMRYKDTAKFTSDLARRGAKYNTSLIVASQSFREFTTEEGLVLMNQCDTRFFLKMQHSDAIELGQIFNLPKPVIDRIETFAQGEGILTSGMESAIVQFVGFPFERELLESDPEAVITR